MDYKGNYEFLPRGSGWIFIPFCTQLTGIGVTTWTGWGMPMPLSRATVTSMQTAESGHGGCSVHTRTVGPLIHFQVEVIVLASTSHDIWWDIWWLVCLCPGLFTKFCCYNICKLQNTANTFCWPIGLSYIKVIARRVAWDLWQCKQILSSAYALGLGLSTTINICPRAITITNNMVTCYHSYMYVSNFIAV